MDDYSFDSILSSGGSIGEAWTPPSGGTGGSEPGEIWDSFNSLFKGAMGSSQTSTANLPAYSPSTASSSVNQDHSGWTVATGGSRASVANNELVYVLMGLGVVLLMLVSTRGRR